MDSLMSAHKSTINNFYLTHQLACAYIDLTLCLTGFAYSDLYLLFELVS